VKQIPCSKIRRRRLWWILALLLVLAGAATWLNGPGIRWLAPKLADRFLANSGMHVEFVMHGSLTGGVTIHDLGVTSDGLLGRLEIGKIEPDYRLRDLLQRRLRGLRIERAAVELRLDSDAPDKPHARNEMPDIGQLAGRVLEAAGRIRKQVHPLDLQLENIAASVTRDGGFIMEIGPSSLQHLAGEDAFRIQLGAMRNAAGNTLPAQDALVTWKRESLTVDRMDPLPGVSLRGLDIRLDQENALAATAELRLGDAVFSLATAPGLGSLAIDLREGDIDTGWLAETFAIDPPFATTLTSLSLTLDNPLPEPARATGELRMLMENTRHGEWQVPELSVDLALEESRATAAASGRALGTGFLIRAQTMLDRSGDRIVPAGISGTINMADVSALAAGLAGRIEAVELQDDFPRSTADGSFRVGLRDLKATTAELDLVLKPVDEDGPATVYLTGAWQADGPLSATMQTTGARIAASMEDDIYHGDAAFDGFRSLSIAGWLSPFGIDPGGGHTLTATWSGGGDIGKKTHHGRLELEEYQLVRAQGHPLTATADVSYNWPQRVDAVAVKIESGAQSVRAVASLADGWLQLDALQWSDGGRELLGGSAKLPAPMNPGEWRDTLANDKRPLQADIASAVLPLSLLNEWLPAAADIDARSTGKVDLRISGTYAMPGIDAAVVLRDVKDKRLADFPAADLDVKLTGRDGRLMLDGSLTTPGYPAAQLTATMPFRPARWAEDPASAAAEPVEARADVPRLDLAKLAGLAPVLKNLGGTAAGRIDLAGTLGKPIVNGRIELADVTAETVDERIPRITGGAAVVAFTPGRIVMDGLRATIAGGTLRGDGTLTLLDGKPDSYDIRLTGNALPLLRNDSMIVRADASLRVAGKHPTPSLTGSVAVVNSLFFRDIELMPVGVPFTTPSAAKLPGIDAPRNPAAAVPGFFREWPLDLRVTTGNPFLIRGNVASGRITADVRVRGTLGNPLPDGEAQIIDLKARLPFSSLEVKRGKLRFTPETGFDPILDIRATSNPRPYSVNGYVHGRASNPQLMLTSSPPLPENEIMTLLATGTTTSGLEDPQAASSRALQLLLEETRRGRNVIGRQLRPLLAPLDRVDFTLAENDPYSSDSFTTATLELTDRWFLSAGMSDDGDTRVLAIWRLVFH
jgi:hypothetical protein